VTQVPNKPNFWQRLLGQTPPPTSVKTTFYVCCPECAAKAMTDPESYLGKVLIERAVAGR
jgi:hypothetical protein